MCGTARADQRLRIVVLNGDALEVVRGLGAMDQVVGVSETLAAESEFWPELAKVPVVGRWNEPSLERIAELKPDRVLCYRRTPGPELEKTLARIGIGVIRLDVYRPSTMVAEIRELGKLLGRASEAERLVEWWQKRLADIQARVPRGSTLPKVLIEGYGRFRTASAGTGMHEMVELAGGQNLAAALPAAYPEINPEWVLDAAPDVIVKTASVRHAYAAKSADVLRPTHADLLGRTGWGSLPAIKNGRAYVLAPDIGPGPRAIVGIIYLAKWLNPKATTDLDPEAIHREYLRRFQQQPLHGHFVFPER